MINTANEEISFIVPKLGAYHVFQSPEFSLDISKYVQLIERSYADKTQLVTNALSGRGVILKAQLEDIGAVIIKTYRRGGILRYFIADKYLRCNTPRSKHEFQVLNRVRALGVSAPQPVAWVTKGKILYHAWLITREIENSINLTELMFRDCERARQIMLELARQIGILIDHGILHIDLHPGNVLICPNDQVSIVDFDKAHQFLGSRKHLRDLYLRRWRRAVLKHGLPDLLSELLCLNLRYATI